MNGRRNIQTTLYGSERDITVALTHELYLRKSKTNAKMASIVTRPDSLSATQSVITFHLNIFF